MLSAFKIPKKNSVSFSIFKPVLPLLPEVLSNVADKEKSGYITMELSTAAGGAGKYKKHLAYFDDGSPQEWITFQKDMAEVWAQNGITSPDNRMAIIRTILRGETLTTFEAAVAERRVGPEGTTLDLTMAMVEEALSEVTTSIFPHRALDFQKHWMKKYLKKPQDMSIRSTSAALNRLNNCLPFFPGGSESSKFSDSELVEILEFSLPLEWRQKFDFDGYIPMDGTKAQLIHHGEAIERSLDSNPVEKKDKQPQGKKAKFAKSDSKKESSTATYVCTVHGTNRTHSTENCFTLKNKQANTQKHSGKRTFTPKGLRHEINLLCKDVPKDKVLEQYMAVIQKEKAKLKKQKKKAQKSKAESSSEESSSDSDLEVHMIEEIKNPKRHKLEEEALKDYEKSEEEIAYLSAIYKEDSASSMET